MNEFPYGTLRQVEINLATGLAIPPIVVIGSIYGTMAESSGFSPSLNRCTSAAALGVKPREGPYEKAERLESVYRSHSNVTHSRWTEAGADECFGERAEDA
jgi:hypothetical protein